MKIGKNLHVYTKSLEEVGYTRISLTSTAIVFLIIGIVSLVGGIIFKGKYAEKIATYDATDAVVYDYEERQEERRDDDGTYYTTTMYCELFEYYVGNARYTAKSSTYSNYRNHHIGYSETIYYNPSNPQEYILSGDNRPTMAIVLGVVFIIVSTVVIGVGIFRKRYV